jgi:hypothetical protein
VFVPATTIQHWVEAAGEKKGSASLDHPLGPGAG